MSLFSGPGEEVYSGKGASDGARVSHISFPQSHSGKVGRWEVSFPLDPLLPSCYYEVGGGDGKPLGFSSLHFLICCTSGPQGP